MIAGDVQRGAARDVVEREHFASRESRVVHGVEPTFDARERFERRNTREVRIFEQLEQVHGPEVLEARERSELIVPADVEPVAERGEHFEPG